MQIVHGLEELPPSLRGVVASVGNFDGVHRGHQRIVGLLVEMAKATGLKSLVVTFDPHPAKVLNPRGNLLEITTLKRRLELIAAHGVDLCLCIPFTEEFSRMGAREFAERVLVQKLGARVLLVGHNFSFGRGREGSPILLKELGRELGFEVQVVEPVTLGETAISSSGIRSAISAGQVGLARLMIGRPFDLEGVVTRGRGYGAGLGFSTANLICWGELLPGDGVYACWVEMRGQLFKAAANIGVAPTLKGDEHSLEVHLLDFSGDLYGEKLRVYFIDRLRDEMKFESPDALKRQIEVDVQATREILSQVPHW